jgi:hypothetical protein
MELRYLKFVTMHGLINVKFVLSVCPHVSLVLEDE